MPTYQRNGTPTEGAAAWSWTRTEADAPRAPQGNAVVFIGGGETGAKHAVAEDQLHQLNGLARQVSSSCFRYGEVGADIGRDVITLGDVEGWLLLDGETRWLRSREAEALDLASIAYSYHTNPGIAADTEEARRLFVEAQQQDDGKVTDPYAQRAVPAAAPLRPSEWAAAKGANEAGVVVLLASAGSGSGQGAIQGIIECDEFFS